MNLIQNNDDAEWFGHALIARNICPLHEDQPAEGCSHGCTWFVPSTEEPDRTLTAVERYAPTDHECGYTFRPGLGYLPNDTECEPCRELATDQWKSTWLRPPKPVLTAEPPDLSVVEIVYFQDWRDVAQRDDGSSDSDGPSRWFVTGSIQVWTWAELTGQSGIAAITLFVPSQPEVTA